MRTLLLPYNTNNVTPKCAFAETHCGQCKETMVRLELTEQMKK